MKPPAVKPAWAHNPPTIKTADLPWEGYVVVNGDRKVLGIYGSALQVEAEEQAKAFREHYALKVEVLTLSLPKRPLIGQKV